MRFKPVESKRVYMHIIEQIEEMIAKGELKRGDRLPSEMELRKSFNVSRASIREAFSALEVIGIIESRPGEGTFIKANGDFNSLKPLSLILMLEKNVAEELLELRFILESGCARLAAVRASEEDIVEMQRQIEVMDRMSGYEDACVEADKTFHYLVAKASGNKVLYDVMMAISEAMDFHIKNTRRVLVSDAETMSNFNMQHKKILKAIVKHDPFAAVDAMVEHLNYVENLIKSKLKRKT